jgi:hypothetical protein
MAISTNGTVLTRLAGALYNTQMSNATYSEVKTLDPASLANALYARDFSSSTDLAVATTLVTNLGLASVTGLDNWVAAQLTAAGAGNKGAKIVDLLNGFAQMTADATYGSYATAFNTKVDAALAASQTTGNAGGTFAAAGVPVITNATFVLTTGVDTINGGAGNDTFTADNTGTDVTSTADSLNGGEGSDALNVFSDGAAAALPALTSVETLNVYDQNADVSITATAQASITSVNLIRGDGDMALAVGNNVATVGITDVAIKDAGANNGIVITAGSTATSISVNLANVSVADTADEDLTISGTKVKTVTLNTSGVKSTVEDLVVSGATTVNINAAVDFTAGVLNTAADSTLNISGAGKVTVGQLDNDVDVVNASDNSGGVVLTIAANNPDAKITLGSGKDKVTTDDDGFTSTEKFAVNAGDGEDTLVIAADADVSTTDEGGRYTNFEVIERAINADLDVSVFGATTTITKASIGDGGLTKMQAALAAAITVTADNAGSTFSLATATGTSDSIAFTTANATATASADVTTVTVDGFESMSVAVNSGDKTIAATATDLTAVSFTSAADLKTITLTGSNAVSLDASANAVKVTTINASDIVGGASISTGGQTGALTVTGSAVKDVITLGAVGVGGSIASVAAGAGDDTVATTMSIANSATSIAGGDGADTLSFSDTATTTNSVTVSDNTFRNVSVETIAFSAAIAGDLSWTLGGFANALAAANGGVLKISAKAVALGAAADDITIDASALSAGNSVSIDLKDAGADAASDVALTGSDGNDTIKFEEGTAASDVITTISSGKGNDTITVKTTADHDGKIVVDAGDGDDTIDLSASTSDAAGTDNLVTPGKGNDTIKLDTEGADTDFVIITASTAANNGVDTISNFTQGTGGDVLKIDAFLDATAMNAKLSANPAASDVENDVNLLVDIAGGQDITTADGLTTALAAGGEYASINMAGSAKAVFVTAASSDANVTQNVFFATSDAAGNISVVLVGTIAASDIDSFVAANFNI